MATVLELQSKWAAAGETVARLGALVDGPKVIAEFVADLKALSEASSDKTVTPTEAASMTNYHPESIARLVRQGKVPNYGTKNRPRVKVTDLPKKAATSPAATRKRVARTASSSPSSLPVVSIDSIARDAVAGRIGRA